MERISELLDAVQVYEENVVGSRTVYHLWMTEATNRILELEYQHEDKKEIHRDPISTKTFVFGYFKYEIVVGTMVLESIHLTKGGALYAAGETIMNADPDDIKQGIVKRWWSPDKSKVVQKIEVYP